MVAAKAPGTKTRCRDASAWSEMRLLARLTECTSELYFTATCDVTHVYLKASILCAHSRQHFVLTLIRTDFNGLQQSGSLMGHYAWSLCLQGTDSGTRCYAR